MRFKFLLIGLLVLACLNSAHAVYTITNASDTVLVNEDFSDDSVLAAYWTCTNCNYDTGDTLAITDGAISSVNKLEISPNEINETAGSIRFIARLLINNTDFLNNEFLMAINTAGKEAGFYTKSDDTLDIYIAEIGWPADCVDIEPADVTAYNLYEINVSENDIIFAVNNIEVCKKKWNRTGDAFYTIREQFINGNVTVDYMNYSVPLLSPTLALDLPTNTTYYSSTVDLNYTLNSTDPLAGEPYNCTVTIDGDVNDTYQDSNNTERNIKMIGLSNTFHNVTVNCYDGTENVSETEYFTVNREFNLGILNPLNTTYSTNALNVTYLANTSASDNLNCTVFFSGVVNDTYNDLNDTQRSFFFTESSEGLHNVTVTCDDGGGTNETKTVYYTFSAELELSINSPSNSTYMDSDLTLTYKPNSTFALASNINCSVYFDGGINTTYVDVNNTSRSINFRELNATYHNVTVNCGDGNENLTRTLCYTMEDVNFTLTAGQNATAFEGVTNFYNVTIGINPDIVSDVNASLYWNDTQVGYSYKGKRDLLTYWFNQTFMLPIVTTNNTSVNTKWNVTKLYTNASTYVENSSNTAQACFHAWEWDATTYSVNLIERSLNDISVNVSKLGGVSNPINSTILSTLVWNGSPSTMTATMNTSTLLGYSNTTRVPRIAIGYNWTFGFNVTVNYSLNHGILGYHSRIDTNTTYNYTQIIHKAWIGNCTLNDKVFSQALNFYMYDEETEGAVTENFQAEQINIKLADGSSRNYSLSQMNGSTNYSICIYPFWGDYSSVGIDVKYAINSSSYDVRRYYLVNARIDNSSETINLYNLDGSLMRFTLLDEDNIGIGDSYLNIKRFYSTINGYKTVAMAKTDSEGEASTYLDVKLCTGDYDAVYAVTVINSTGGTLKDFSAQSFTDDDCDGVGSTLLRIAVSTPYTWYILADGISYVQGCTINGTTEFNCASDAIAASGNVTFFAKISVATGLPFTNFTLECIKLGSRRNTLINKTSATASGITLYCELGNTTSGYEYIIKTWGYFGSDAYPINTTILDYKTYATWQSDDDAAFAAFILIGSLTTAGLGHPILMIILNIGGVVLSAMLGLFKFSIVWIINWVLSAIMVILILWRKD